MKSKGEKAILTAADYQQWIVELKTRYRATQIKAAVAVNSALIEFYWNLGKDISEKYPVEIGGETKNIDLLFYVVPLHRYLVMEVKTGKYVPADLGQLSGYLVMAEQCLNTPVDNPPIGVLICKEHNRVLAKFHLDKLGLPMGITDYEIKKILPTPAQLAKCYADAEAQIASSKSAVATKPTIKRSLKDAEHLTFAVSKMKSEVILDPVASIRKATISSFVCR